VAAACAEAVHIILRHLELAEAVPQADAGEKPTEPLGFLGGAVLADAVGVPEIHQNAFFHRLQRSRSKLGDENWQEVSSPRPRAPRFLYRADAQSVRDIAARYSK
jgi:hypothetical protein